MVLCRGLCESVGPCKTDNKPERARSYHELWSDTAMLRRASRSQNVLTKFVFNAYTSAQPQALAATPRSSFITSLISSNSLFFSLWWLFLHAALLHVSGLGYHSCTVRLSGERRRRRLNVAWCFGYCGGARCHLALERLYFKMLYVHSGDRVIT